MMVRTIVHNGTGTLQHCCVGAHANHTSRKLATGGRKQPTFRTAHGAPPFRQAHACAPHTRQPSMVRDSHAGDSYVSHG